MDIFSGALSTVRNIKSAAFPAPVGAPTCVFYLLTGLYVRNRPPDGSHSGPPDPAKGRGPLEPLCFCCFFFSEMPNECLVGQQWGPIPIALKPQMLTMFT